MSKQLPERPSLEHLKNEAKALKKTRSFARLADAQRELAREYGFQSWTKLKRVVEGFDNLRHLFFDAIRAGDRDQVKSFGQTVPNLAKSNDERSFGATPISVAAQRNDLPMIDLLVRLGADVNARSDWWAGSFGPLDNCDQKTADHLLKKGATLSPHAAARLGMAKELQALIAKDPAAVHERGGDGQFPLHFSATPDTVDILVDAGADLEARDLDHESTAAQWRIHEVDVLRRLVERGAETDIFMAVALDDPVLIAKHLEKDPVALNRRANEPGDRMVHHAAPGAPIYTYVAGPVTPILFAINVKSEKAFELLFEKSPPQARLVAAAWKGDRELALKYKDEAQSLISTHGSHICFAARERRGDLLSLMLELGFDLNAQDNEQMSPTMWSGFHGWREGMEILLPRKPDLTLKNMYGGTALGTLCYGSVNGWHHKDAEYARCAELLIEAGSEVLDTMTASDEVTAVLDRYR